MYLAVYPKESTHVFSYKAYYFMVIRFMVSTFVDNHIRSYVNPRLLTNLFYIIHLSVNISIVSICSRTRYLTEKHLPLPSIWSMVHSLGSLSILSVWRRGILNLQSFVTIW